jgi:hypothetical protein
VVVVESVLVSGDVFLNGVVLVSSGTVGTQQTAINASCIASNNSIIVETSPQSGRPFPPTYLGLHAALNVE